jgi:hypothetical protein
MANQAARQATDKADAGDRRPIRRRDRREFDFSQAPVFRKTAALKMSAVEWAAAEQEVVTLIGGAEETRNKAKPGDAIVTGEAGERYVIDRKRFDELYRPDPRDGSRYVSTNVVRAIWLAEATELLAPWGEMQRVEAGGFVVQPLDRPDDVYLIEGQAFAAAYSPAESAR